jgi:hypothetical protein
MREIGIAILLLVVSMLLIGCDGVSPRHAEERYTTSQMREAANQVGMPSIDNYFEKRLAKQIFELRDNSELITFAYTVNLEGKFVYIGKAIGYGLPYSVQYTNPEEYIYTGTTIPQADPNGLYMPAGLSATWLVLINEKTGAQEIVYTEPSIVVTQSKLPRRLCAEWSLPDDY